MNCSKLFLDIKYSWISGSLVRKILFSSIDEKVKNENNYIWFLYLKHKIKWKNVFECNLVSKALWICIVVFFMFCLLSKNPCFRLETKQWGHGPIVYWVWWWCRKSLHLNFRCLCMVAHFLSNFHPCSNILFYECLYMLFISIINASKRRVVFFALYFEFVCETFTFYIS